MRWIDFQEEWDQVHPYTSLPQVNRPSVKMGKNFELGHVVNSAMLFEV